MNSPASNSRNPASFAPHSPNCVKVYAPKAPTVRPTDTETATERRVFDALARMPLQCLTQAQLAAAMPYGTCPYDLARARAAMLADGTIALEGELVILL